MSTSRLGVGLLDDQVYETRRNNIWNIFQGQLNCSPKQLDELFQKNRTHFTNLLNCFPVASSSSIINSDGSVEDGNKNAVAAAFYNFMARQLDLHVSKCRKIIDGFKKEMSETDKNDSGLDQVSIEKAQVMYYSFRLTHLNCILSIMQNQKYKHYAEVSNNGFLYVCAFLTRIYILKQ